MKSISEIVQQWLDDNTEAVRQSYLTKGLKASGAFGDSLKNDLKVDPTKLTAIITGNDYGYYLQYGRGKTTGGGDGSLKSIIRKWIDDKGIIPKDNITKDSLAFLITRKIHEDGIRVPNIHNPGGIFSDVFTPASFHELSKAIRIEFTDNIKSDILKTF